jgi:hypothetical protein
MFEMSDEQFDLMVDHLANPRSVPRRRADTSR